MSKYALIGLVFTIVWTFVICAYVVPRKATIEFYSSAAEIIPVLFLVLAVELRVINLVQGPLTLKGFSMESPVTVLIFLGLVLLFLAAGEVWSLRALSSGRPSDGAASVVWTSMVIGFTTVSYVALFSPRQSSRE